MPPSLSALSQTALVARINRLAKEADLNPSEVIAGRVWVDGPAGTGLQAAIAELKRRQEVRF